MRVALLSAGPSLRQTFDFDAHFDLRIGVNSAAAVAHCDWWACGDGQTFARVEPIGLPVLFTIDPADGWFRMTSNVQARRDRHRVVSWSEVEQRLHPPHESAWKDWSITAALVLAVDLGATSVSVYGHDAVGTVDVAGHALNARRDFWPRVIAAWAATKDWAGGKGVRVIEHRPEPVSCQK